MSFEYESTTGFLSRLKGLLFDKRRSAVLLISRCRCIHTIGLKQSLQLIFLDQFGKVVNVRHQVSPWQVAVEKSAVHVIEVKGIVLPLRAGDHVVCTEFPLALAARSPRGMSTLETLIALPVLLLLTMAVLQVGLLWQAKLGVVHAANVAARAASFAHGSSGAVRDGLVQGLLPLFGKIQSTADLPAAILRSSTELAQGLALGWIRHEVLSPTRQSFQDWGRPIDIVLSPGGKTGELEIPSAPLPALATRMKPRSGISGLVDGLPVGSASGQTLLDANTMKLRLQVGIPLRLPLVGGLLARTLSVYSGCSGFFSDQRAYRVGPLDLGSAGMPSAISNKIECRALGAHDLKGNWTPRWPVEGVAVVRMHSHARESVMALHDRPAK